MKTLALVLSIMILGSSAFAQSSTAPTRKRKSTVRSTASGTTEMQSVRDALAAQQQQINELKQELQQRDQTIQQIQQQLTQTQAAATEAQTKAEAATESAKVVPALQSDVTDLKTNLNSTVQTIQEDQKREGDLESPLAIHYKGITITPGGYLAAETVWRNRGLASDINTPFNAVPFAGSAQHNLSEFFGSARQSRLSLLAE